MMRLVVGSILHGGPIELFYSWCNKGHGMVHIKETLLLIGRVAQMTRSPLYIYIYIYI